MSDKFTVRSSVHDYNVSFTDSYSANLLEQIDPGDIILIDSNVLDFYKDDLSGVVSNCRHITINASEEQKNFLQLSPIIESLIENNFRKNNRLIVVGGGITQDIGAFIASNMYRGVKWFFYPTTLLAQCDSCIGGKSSINFGKYKNQLGNFYPPHEIIIDTVFLNSLSSLDIRSGIGEMIHFYLVSGYEDFIKIKDAYEAGLTNKNILQRLIRRSLMIKKATIEIDEFDKKERLIFNYGHSFGHAIETLTNHRIPHGIAVCYGMDIANFLSVKLGYTDEDFRQTVRELLEKNWNDIELGVIDVNDFINTLKKDKKNIDSQIRVILTRGFGRMFIAPLEVNHELADWLGEYFETHS